MQLRDMDLSRTFKARCGTPVLLALVACATAAALFAVVISVDVARLTEAVGAARDEPLRVLGVLSAFGLAFVLRAAAWRRVLPALEFGQALSGIHLALGANHVLPLRLGEPLRVASVVRRTDVGLDEATASVVALRSTDMLTLVAIGAIAAPATLATIAGWIGWMVLVLVVGVGLVGILWLLRLARRGTQVRPLGTVALGLSLIAWVCEATLVWQCATWAGLQISWAEALAVTAVSVAAQVAAIAPGGFGTYEAAAVAAYVALGHNAGDALVAALTAHTLKTAYSLVGGVAAMAVPRPSLLGRFRLSRHLKPMPPASSPPPTQAPVMLFMPAHNEEQTVGACVERVPETVCGHPVQVLVIDDGSSDSTSERARAAGAEVYQESQNRGLGAAVRRGLAMSVERDAVAVAFCDADGEYAPEELDVLIAPILEGKADYVVGSRFAGRIDHMMPHRRFGNRVLTLLLSVITRRRITDGQTGYRALSQRAAADAEVIHDFNYAQVMTLDLLAKGYSYLEVPITYRFRSTGESFVKLGSYLRHVVPAVHRQLNTA